jgi:hypothetical protein
MFALIYHALLRSFGFGAAAAKPPLTDPLPNSLTFQRLLEQAEALKKRPPPEPMTWGEAVGILARHAGQRPASQARPPERRVKLARAVLPLVVLQYLHVLEVLDRAFPKAGSDDDAAFERRLMQLARTDVQTWLAGLYSGKEATIPAHITEVFVQRAANAMGHRQPHVMRVNPAPTFFADAEMQVHVVDRRTSFCVFPHAIVRGDADLIELPGTGKRFHWDTANLSHWELQLGFAGTVFNPPAIPEAERDGDDVTADLTPKWNPK